MKSEYGERLKIFRKSLGLSLDKFANRIGVSKATMINYEKGGTIPNIELISRMVTEFNLNFNWLITGKNESMIKKKDLMSVIPCLEKFDEETITSITETLM
jgi:transcriptional regulator with XRE-family HTH domain